MAKLQVGDRVTIYRKVATPLSPWMSPFMDYIVGLSGLINKDEGEEFFIMLDGEDMGWWIPKYAVKREKTA